MCRDFGTKNKCNNCLRTYSGECTFGIYATAIFKTEQFPWFQVWHLSNGKDFMFVTYICKYEPVNKEVEEAYEIVMNLDIKFEDKHYWKFW